MTITIRPVGDEILIVTGEGTQIHGVLEFGEVERIEAAAENSIKAGVTPSIEIRKPDGEVVEVDIFRVQKFGKET